MKVGDLVRQGGHGLERTGIIVSTVHFERFGFHSRLFNVLWNKRSPTLPTLVGPAWESKIEVISESR
jgi:hypothetical protein